MGAEGPVLFFFGLRRLRSSFLLGLRRLLPRSFGPPLSLSSIGCMDGRSVSVLFRCCVIFLEETHVSFARCCLAAFLPFGNVFALPFRLFSRHPIPFGGGAELNRIKDCPMLLPKAKKHFMTTAASEDACSNTQDRPDRQGARGTRSQGESRSFSLAPWQKTTKPQDKYTHAL